ncbi:hypothetical protein [Streptomyces sp. NPDC007856]|uniref:hypothetical protein n=1 Tax=Streptomyces sp. NPDC007856 TaxID=3364781 RepID=UPI0036CB017C
MKSPLPQEFYAEEYAARLLAASGCTRPVGLVVSYCLASSIGYEVARQVTSRQGSAPVLVALDGSPCPAESVLSAYREAAVRFAEDDAVHLLQPTESDLIERPKDVLAAMERELTDLAARSLREEELEEDLIQDMVEDLVHHTVDWLTHLVAAHNASFLQWEGDVVLVSSRDQPFEGPWPGARSTRVVRVDCSRAELLDQPRVRRAIADCMPSRL